MFRFSRFAFVLLFVALFFVLLLPAIAQGLNLNEHCIRHGRARAVAVGSTAYDIKCEDSSGNLWDISIQSACDEQYGSGTVARYRDFNDVNSWYCDAGNSNNNPPPSNNGGGNNSGGNNNNPPPSNNNSSSSYGGGMDIVGWCRSVGHSGATYDGDAYSWYCTNHDGSRARGIDVDPVCQFSSGGSHPHAGLTDIGNPYSWYCATTPQGRPSSNNGGNQPSQPSNNNNSGSGNNGSGNNNSNSSNNCDFAPLNVGGRGRVTAGVSNRLRSGPGTGYERIDSIQPFQEFDVLSGPSCANGYNWYEVRLNNGTTGYTAAGSYGDPWLETVSSSSGSESSNSGNDEPQWYDFYYRPFDTTYSLLVDSSDLNNCVIKNGPEILVQELRRSMRWLIRSSENEPVTTTLNDTYLYLMNDGHLDTFRVSLDSFLVREIDCQHSYFQMGSKTMDLYGLGNTVFGYHAVWIPNGILHDIADIAQQVEDGRNDFPDDSDQIDLGYNIALDVIRGENLSVALVLNNIPSNFIESR